MYADISCRTLSGRNFDSLRARLLMLSETRRRLVLPFREPRAPDCRDEDILSRRKFLSYLFNSLPRSASSLLIRTRCLSSQSTVAPLPCISVVSLQGDAACDKGSRLISESRSERLARHLQESHLPKTLIWPPILKSIHSSGPFFPCMCDRV